LSELAVVSTYVIYMQKIYSKDTNDSELEIYSLSFGQFGSEQVTSWSEDEVHPIPFDFFLHLNGKIVKAIFREL
jgi:hypothetical protein